MASQRKRIFLSRTGKTALLQRLLIFVRKRNKLTKGNQILPFDQEKTEEEGFRLSDITWKAWRQGKRTDTNSSLRKTTAQHCRRSAVSEEIEKHVWFNDYNLREIRRFFVLRETLINEGLLWLLFKTKLDWFVLHWTVTREKADLRWNSIVIKCSNVGNLFSRELSLSQYLLFNNLSVDNL